MAIREILQISQSGGNTNDDSFLRTSTKPVVEINEEVLNVINDLRDTLRAYPFCIGLSAPQIGESYAISVLNFEHSDEKDDKILINPHILSLSGKKDKKRESCMSVWGYMGEVERRDKVEIEYLDLDMNLRRESFEGFNARAIQHEIDHLNGIVYYDKMVDKNKLLKANFFDEYKILKN